MSVMHGASQVIATLKKIAEKFPDYVAAAMYQEAQIMMTEAKRRTPVEYGNLRASGRVAPPVREGKRISVTLSFGTPYAIYVHENLTANHANPPFGGGQAKFLESVLDEARPTLAERIAKRVHFNNMGGA